MLKHIHRIMGVLALLLLAFSVVAAVDYIDEGRNHPRQNKTCLCVSETGCPIITAHAAIVSPADPTTGQIVLPLREEGLVLGSCATGDL